MSLPFPPLENLIVTYTISIDRDGNIYNDVQPHASYGEVYKAFIAIKEEVDRQIAERRVCPFNPKYGSRRGYTEYEDEDRGAFLWANCEITGCTNQVCLGMSKTMCYPHAIEFGEFTKEEFERNRANRGK